MTNAQKGAVILLVTLGVGFYVGKRWGCKCKGASS
jgi:hypothetical protein